MNFHSHEIDLLLVALDLPLHGLPHGVPHPAAELQLFGALLSVLLQQKTMHYFNFSSFSNFIQPADIGLPTGNGKKLSCSQAQLGQATGLAVA